MTRNSPGSGTGTSSRMTTAGAKAIVKTWVDAGCDFFSLLLSIILALKLNKFSMCAISLKWLLSILGPRCSSLINDYWKMVLDESKPNQRFSDHPQVSSFRSGIILKLFKIKRYSADWSRSCFWLVCIEGSSLYVGHPSKGLQEDARVPNLKTRPIQPLCNFA